MKHSAGSVFSGWRPSESKRSLKKKRAKSLIRAAKTDFFFYFRSAGSQTQVFGFALHFAHQDADQTGPGGAAFSDEHSCKETIHQATGASPAAG